MRVVSRLVIDGGPIAIGDREGGVRGSISSRVRRTTSPIVSLWRAAAFLLLAVAAVCSASSPGAAQAADGDAPAVQPASQTPAKIPSAMCLSCHGAEGFAVEESDGKTRSLFVEAGKFGHSVHGGRRMRRVPYEHYVDPPPADPDQGRLRQLPRELVGKGSGAEGKTQQFATLGFVTQQINKFMNSIHAQPSMADQSQTNATCYNCHDAHYVYPPGTPSGQRGG